MFSIIGPQSLTIVVRNEAEGKQDMMSVLKQCVELFAVFPVVFHIFGDTHLVLYLIWSCLISLIFLSCTVYLFCKCLIWGQGLRLTHFLLLPPLWLRHFCLQIRGNPTKTGFNNQGILLILSIKRVKGRSDFRWGWIKNQTRHEDPWVFCSPISAFLLKMAFIVVSTSATNSEDLLLPYTCLAKRKHYLFYYP